MRSPSISKEPLLPSGDEETAKRCEPKMTSLGGDEKKQGENLNWDPPRTPALDLAGGEEKGAGFEEDVKRRLFFSSRKTVRVVSPPSSSSARNSSSPYQRKSSSTWWSLMQQAAGPSYKILSRNSDALSLASGMPECSLRRNIFVAKFYIDPSDDISVALLCASETEAGALIILSCLCPLTIVILVCILLAHMPSHPGLDYISSKKSPVDLIIGSIAVGFFMMAQLAGPLTRPFYVLRQFISLRKILSNESSSTRAKLRRAEVRLVLKYLSSIAIVFVSVAAGVLEAGSEVNILRTIFALSWMMILDQIIVKEVVYRFYQHCTVVIAVSNIRWIDSDAKTEFWRKSASNKKEIKRGLCSFETCSAIKWQLFVSEIRGLGLGGDGDNAPVSADMEIMLVKWSKIDETSIAAMGSIAAEAVHKNEWLYDMVKEQRTSFFKHYPLKARRMPWGGSVRLDIDGLDEYHLSSVVHIIRNPMNHIDELYIHCNRIEDAQAEELARAFAANKSITKLWMFYNEIGDKGASSLAHMLQENDRLKTLHLRGNAIGNHGAFALSKAVRRNTSLEVLGLDRNKIGVAGAYSLIVALDENVSIKRLWLMDNDFHPDKLIDHIVQHRPEILLECKGVMKRAVIANCGLLAPVLKTIVRTRLEELKLSPAETRQTRKKLDNWNKAVRNHANTPNFQRQETQVDVEISSHEVKDIVEEILNHLPKIKVAEMRNHLIAERSRTSKICLASDYVRDDAG